MRVFRLADSFLVSIAKLMIVIGVFFLVINVGFNFLNENRKEFRLVDSNKLITKLIYSTINDPELQKDKSSKTFVTLYKTFACGAIGQACTDNPEDAKEYFSKSWVGMTSNLLTITYSNPPASSIYSVQNTLANKGFIPAAYAAEGIGFSSIKPIAKIWKVFRDFSYIFLVLILIAMGFMIMFRMKLNPQTVIGIENSLPKIVVALILITFSFAIAGVLIDLMYVLIAVGISLLTDFNIGDLTKANTQLLQNKYMGAGLSAIWPYQGRSGAIEVGHGLYNILPPFIKEVVGGAVTLPVAILLSKSKLHVVNNLILSFRDIAIGPVGFGDIVSALTLLFEVILIAILFPQIPGFIIGVIILLTLLFFMFRIFFLLLSSYIKIMLFIIFSPIILLFVSIPGKNTFSFWLKNMIGELMVFPLVVLIMLVGYAIQSLTIANETLFRPPFLYEISGDVFGAIIGMGLILMTPKIIMAVKEAMGIKPGLGVGARIFFGGVSTVAGSVYGSLIGIGSLSHALTIFSENGPVASWLKKLKGAQETAAANKPVQ